MAVTAQLLSGSTNGRPVLVAATGTPGTTIHTATSTANTFDEVWLWAHNTSTTAVKLTLELGGTTSPNDLIEITIPPESGLVPVLPGVRLNGGVVIRAFAGTTNVLNIVGNVNRWAQ